MLHTHKFYPVGVHPFYRIDKAGAEVPVTFVLLKCQKKNCKETDDVIRRGHWTLSEIQGNIFSAQIIPTGPLPQVSYGDFGEPTGPLPDPAGDVSVTIKADTSGFTEYPIPETAGVPLSDPVTPAAGTDPYPPAPRHERRSGTGEEVPAVPGSARKKDYLLSNSEKIGSWEPGVGRTSLHGLPVRKADSQPLGPDY